MRGCDLRPNLPRIESPQSAHRAVLPSLLRVRLGHQQLCEQRPRLSQDVAAGRRLRRVVPQNLAQHRDHRQPPHLRVRLAAGRRAEDDLPTDSQRTGCVRAGVLGGPPRPRAAAGRQNARPRANALRAAHSGAVLKVKRTFSVAQAADRVGPLSRWGRMEYTTCGAPPRWAGRQRRRGAGGGRPPPGGDPGTPQKRAEAVQKRVRARRGLHVVAARPAAAVARDVGAHRGSDLARQDLHRFHRHVHALHRHQQLADVRHRRQMRCHEGRLPRQRRPGRRRLRDHRRRRRRAAGAAPRGGGRVAVGRVERFAASPSGFPAAVHRRLGALFGEMGGFGGQLSVRPIFRPVRPPPLRRRRRRGRWVGRRLRRVGGQPGGQPGLRGRGGGPPGALRGSTPAGLGAGFSPSRVGFTSRGLGWGSPPGAPGAGTQKTHAVARQARISRTIMSAGSTARSEDTCLVSSCRTAPSTPARCAAAAPASTPASIASMAAACAGRRVGCAAWVRGVGCWQTGRPGGLDARLPRSAATPPCRSRW